MPHILSIETSTRTCSVAIHDGPRLITAQDLHLDKSHSGSLTLMIQNLLALAGISIADIQAVAVSKGPGSYTGLRIGLSTAKGLCYAKDIPLIGIGTLEAMAWQAAQNNPLQALLCPMIDARRMEVYCLIADPEGNTLQEVQPVIVEEEAFAERLRDKHILFFGDGAPKCTEVLSHSPHAHVLQHIKPSAIGVGGLAWEAYQQERFEDLAYFEPFYLKEFQAKKPKKLL